MMLSGPRTRRVVFGKWLKGRRESLRLTQLELAKCLSYENPQIISNIERGFSALPSARVCEFAHALKCSSLEMELRRVHSSTKDEGSVVALETAITAVPLMEMALRETLTVSDAVATLNSVRLGCARQPVSMTEASLV